MKTAAVIRGVAYHVPERAVSNDDLSKFMETSDEWIRTRTGISNRYFASINESTSDLAIAASKKLLKKLDVDPQSIDLILAATLSPDHFFPGIGVQIQHGIGAATAPGIDIRGQCSGFAWGLATADAYVRMGLYKNVLVVGAEIHSRLFDLSTRGRNLSVLFGDAAGAVLVSAVPSEELPSTKNNVRGLIDHYMGSDGSGLEQLAMLRPGLGRGFEAFASPDEIKDIPFSPVMDGPAVYRHAVTRMAECANALLKRNNIEASDLDLVVPHQANMRINETLRNTLKLPESKVHNTIERFGNTTAATLPIGMADAVEAGKLKPGNLVLTVAFGSGFTWGANLFRW